jgi:hypothetical protein
MTRPKSHYCYQCYWQFEDEERLSWCGESPEMIGIIPNRPGCKNWECAYCGGCFDNGENHDNCMIIEVELEI